MSSSPHNHSGLDFTPRLELPSEPANFFALDPYDLWHIQHLALAHRDTAQLLLDEPALMLPALDLYAYLYLPSPDPSGRRVAPICRAWVKRLMVHPEVQKLRQRSILNEWTTAAALGPMLRQLKKLLDDARDCVEQEKIQEAYQRHMKGQGSDGEEKSLEEILEPLPPLSSLLLMEDLALKLPPLDGTFESSGAMAENMVDAPESPFEDPLSAGTVEAEQEVLSIEEAARQLAELMEQCSPHGSQRGVARQIPMEQALWLGQILTRHPVVTEIVDLAGRMTETLRKKPPGRGWGKGSLETHSVERGGTLSRLLPSELMGLKHPILRRATMARILEGRALQYALRAPEHLARGPIILVVDSSASMQGGRTLFAKALMMSLGLLCWQKRRPFVMLTFGARGVLQEHRVRAGSPFWPRVRRALSTVFGGGTDFDTPLFRVAEISEEKDWSKADVVFITDGEGSCSEAARLRLDEVRSRCDLRVVGVSLGGGEGLDEFADDIYQLDTSLMAHGSSKTTMHALPILRHLSHRV